MTDASLERKVDDHYDVVIIGAGINGAGTFRELCLQGLSCLLIDKADFSSGTSSAPSRLIHGGLKYVETGEFGLVAESTLERNLLLKNAGHFVKPLPTLIPATSFLNGFASSLMTFLGRPRSMKSRGAFLIKIGLSIYDWYGRKERTMPRHKMFFGNKVQQEMPNMSPQIVALGSYYDAMITQPERLVLELVEDGLKASPSSQALNYASIVSTNRSGIVLADAISAKRACCETSIVVNAAGPWIDNVNQLCGEKTQFIGGTKGSHIVLNHPDLVEILGDHMVYFEGEDGRIVLAFVYHGNVLVGSTDVPSSDPDNISCSDDEVEYFFDSLKQLFPGIDLMRNQIVFTYCGIRPLPRSQSSDPGLISRDHSMPILETRGERDFLIYSLVGGKWTTFRAFAEQICDDVLRRLNRTRKVSSRNLLIGGDVAEQKSEKFRDQISLRLSEKFALPTKHIVSLIARYGVAKTELILASFDKSELSNPSFIAGLMPGEIKWLLKNERVHHLSDIVLRRTEIAFACVQGSELEKLSHFVAETLNWSKHKLMQEKDALASILLERHRMKWAGSTLSYSPAKSF